VSHLHARDIRGIEVSNDGTPKARYRSAGLYVVKWAGELDEREGGLIYDRRHLCYSSRWAAN
jgi:hypothetical protein